IRPNNHIDVACFIFERDEHNAICCLRALAPGYDPASTSQPSIGILVDERTGGSKVAVLKLPAQQGKGMAYQGQAQRVIVGAGNLAFRRCWQDWLDTVVNRCFAQQSVQGGAGRLPACLASMSGYGV